LDQQRVVAAGCHEVARAPTGSTPAQPQKGGSSIQRHNFLAHRPTGRSHARLTASPQPQTLQQGETLLATEEGSTMKIRKRPEQWRKERAERQQTAAADRWLQTHMDDQPVKATEQAAERQRMRMEQQQQRQQWDDKRNAAEIRRRNRQERIAQLKRGRRP
jgi:hypothetical protein